MTRAKIAAVLFKMKKEGAVISVIDEVLYSADELLTKLAGREITEEEGFNFIH